jgi:sensor histidine kinase YesM
MPALPASRNIDEPPRRELLHGLMFGLATAVLIGVAIALVLAAIERGGLRYKLIYSISISLCCWSIVDAVRRVIAFVLLRRARQRGLPLELSGPSWPVVLLLVVLTVLLGPSAGLAIGDAITGIESKPQFNFGSGSSRTTMTMTAIGTGIALAIWSVQARLARERLAAEQARKAALEQQLLMLQTQLEPHMLFNTLANLRVLIGTDAERAQAMLDRLIAFLRATLAASRSGRHALADEFARLADYLELMAVRMGPRLAVRFELPADLAQARVPPLLLQPLVENAIRHGLEPQVGGGEVRISAERIVEPGQPARLRLKVTDNGVGLDAPRSPPPPTPPPPATAAGGFGTRQVHERLAALFGSAASFELQAAPSGHGTWAVVTLPLELPASTA